MPGIAARVSHNEGKHFPAHYFTVDSNPEGKLGIGETTVTKILSFLLSGLFLVSAQTKIDLDTQSFGAVTSTQVPPIRGEDEWCSSPTFSRFSDIQLLILPNGSVEVPCYLHFSMFPVKVFEFGETAKVTLNGTVGDDLLFVYWKLENEVPKLYVSAKDTTTLVCKGCSVVARTDQAFPRDSIAVGMYGILSGKFAANGHPIISSHQIGFVEGTGALIQYYPSSGYTFQVQGLAQAPQVARLKAEVSQAAAELEVARTNAQVRQMEDFTVPENRLAEVEVKVAQASERLSVVAASIPPSPVDVQQLKADLTNAKTQLQDLQQVIRQALQSYMDNQLEQVTMRYQQAQQALVSQAAGTKVAPPKVATEKCSEGQWAIDAKYKYECLSGAWLRFSRDTAWR